MVSPEEVDHHVIRTETPGPNGEQYCWYQCTIRGGREGRDLDAVSLARACAELGAGEILLNCIDKDGTNSGFDLELINAVRSAVTIPVIASSGAGCAEHFWKSLKRPTPNRRWLPGFFTAGRFPSVPSRIA